MITDYAVPVETRSHSGCVITDAYGNMIKAGCQLSIIPTPLHLDNADRYYRFSLSFTSLELDSTTLQVLLSLLPSIPFSNLLTHSMKYCKSSTSLSVSPFIRALIRS